MDEGREIDWSAHRNNLPICNRWFIDKGCAGIFETRADSPPTSDASPASQSSVRNNPWAMADRGDNRVRGRGFLNEADCLRFGSKRVRIPGSTRNDYYIIVVTVRVIEKPIELYSAAFSAM
jgi:hypothetical protein